MLLARANLGLSRDRASQLSGVSHDTQRRVEEGDPGVSLVTLCRVADALGLDISLRAFPGRTPSLRDTGQLTLAEHLVALAHPSLRCVLEHPVAGGRSADLVLFGATEIFLIEIERMAADFQAQYRLAAAKREALQEKHQRPVRLILAVEDTRRNRHVMAPHLHIIRTAAPATSREVLAALRAGTPLGRDGLLWIRPRR